MTLTLIPEERALILKKQRDPNLAWVWQLLEQVVDPELPMLSLVDLGVVIDLHLSDEALQISLIPTHSGCPAQTAMAENLQATLMPSLQAKQLQLRVRYQLSPVWQASWISEAGIAKLYQNGIGWYPHADQLPKCPRCLNENTQSIAEFGATACKALFRCLDCLEPFEAIKP